MPHASPTRSVCAALPVTNRAPLEPVCHRTGEEQPPQPQVAGMPTGFKKKLSLFKKMLLFQQRVLSFSGVSMGKRTCQLTGFYCTFCYFMETDFYFFASLRLSKCNHYRLNCSSIHCPGRSRDAFVVLPANSQKARCRH